MTRQKTLKQYWIRGAQLMSRCSMELGLPGDGTASPDEVVAWLLRKKPSIAKATYRQYKSALIFVLTTLGSEEELRASKENLTEEELSWVNQYLINTFTWLTENEESGKDIIDQARQTVEHNLKPYLYKVYSRQEEIKANEISAEDRQVKSTEVQELVDNMFGDVIQNFLIHRGRDRFRTEGYSLGN